MKEKEMKMIGTWIAKVLKNELSAAEVKKEVMALCKRFPIPERY
jgi:glycine/serine hydroxymethyltransferase